MNSHSIPLLYHSECLGLWLSGVVEHWGINAERWLWKTGGLGKLGEYPGYPGRIKDAPYSVCPQQAFLGIISGASVYITTDNFTIQFIESPDNPGYYFSEYPAAGSIDITYELNIQHEENNYTAETYMIPVPPANLPTWQYDADKDCFFENIDVFVFPTKNEAEPLVIYEAMQHGLPIITYGRGCIPEIIDTKCGLVIPPDQPFAPLALEQIKKWLASPVLFESASRAAENRFTQILKVNMQCCEALKEEILDGYMNE